MKKRLQKIVAAAMCFILIAGCASKDNENDRVRTESSLEEINTDDSLQSAVDDSVSKNDADINFGSFDIADNKYYEKGVVTLADDEYYDAVRSLVQLPKSIPSIKTTQSGDMTSDDEDFETMRILVTGDADEDVLEDYDAKVIISDGNGHYILQFESSEETKEAYEGLTEELTDCYVEEDFVINAFEGESAPSNITSSPKYDYLTWGGDRIGAEKFVDTLTSAQKSQSLIVAVIDTGVSTSHSMLRGKLVTGTSIIGNSYEDGNGHGTHVAGTIIDVTSGTAVKVMPVQVLGSNGSGSMLSVASGVSYAYQNGAAVINLSLGGVDYSTSHYLDSVIKNATASGTVVCVAAGNDNTNMQYTCPAHISGALCVAAVDDDDDRAYFSNYGNNVGIAAPGVDIYSSYLNNSYASLSGTSMATPHVSAAAALVKLSGRATSPAAIISLLKSASDDRGSSGWDIYYGQGVVNLANIINMETPEESISPSPTVSPTPVTPTPTPVTPTPTPVQPTPVQPTPVQPTPVQPTPVQPTPVYPTPVQPTPVYPTPVYPTPVYPVPNVPSYGMSVSVSSSSVNGRSSAVMYISTGMDPSEYTFTVDGMDYKPYMISDGNGQYHVDLSNLGRGSHTYLIQYYGGSSNGSFSL